MSLDFCAIDFETANSSRGSPCAVGLALVEGGYIVGTKRMLMRPPESVAWFDDFNIELHGITEAMVENEPRFADRLPEILEYARGLPLVAHNAAFDLGVIRDACDESEIEWPTLTYACTLVLSRRSYDLLSYSLPWAAQAAGFPIAQHHDPEADALSAAHILLAIAAAKSATDLRSLLDATYCVLGHLGPDAWNGCTHDSTAGVLPSANPNADPRHPFYGREIVFTGALSWMLRARAWELVAGCGGQPAEGVTKLTNILVIGYQDARKLRPGEDLSAKARKAAALRDKGQAIELLGEVDFVRMLAL
jgi:DNA polymerase III, epsilon subunit and related 3''-5'' exonucleases